MSAATTSASKPNAVPSEVEPSEVQRLRSDVEQAGRNVQRFEAQLADDTAGHRRAEDAFHVNPEGASAPKLETAERRVRETGAHLNAERRRLERLRRKLDDPEFHDLARKLDDLREQGADHARFWTDAEPDLARFYEFGAEVGRAWLALVGRLDAVAELRAKAQGIADQIDAKADIGGPSISDLKLRAGRTFAEGVKSQCPIDGYVADLLDVKFYR